MKLCIFLVGLSLSGSAVLSAQEAQIVRPNASSFTLDNGMLVVLIEDHRAPTVTHMVWYRVGAADEPRGKSGIAHFLEHLMFKGTKDIAPGDFSKIVARNGGSDNAFTSQDYTGYYQRIARDRLDLVMEMEADRMHNLTLRKEDVLPERDVILEERNSRIENRPGSLLSEQMSAALYLNHPYGISIIGWAHEMAALTRQDALDFYKTYYAPNNAILVVAGDVTMEDLKPMAQKYYGGVAAQDIPSRIRVQEPPTIAARRVELQDDKVREPRFSRYYLAPGFLTAEPGEAEALEILSDVLGGGTTSRLYKKLVVEQKVATSAGAWYSSSAVDTSEFGIYAAPAQGVSLEDLENHIEAVVAELLKEGVTTQEVDDARNQALDSTVYALDNQFNMARIFGSRLASGQTMDQILSWPDRMSAVDKDSVNSVMQKVLRDERSVTGLLRAANPDKG